MKLTSPWQHANNSAQKFLPPYSTPLSSRPLCTHKKVIIKSFLSCDDMKITKNNKLHPFSQTNRPARVYDENNPVQNTRRYCEEQVCKQVQVRIVFAIITLEKYGDRGRDERGMGGCSQQDNVVCLSSWIYQNNAK